MIKKKPIICSRCGKQVGWVSMKLRLKIKFIFIGFLIALLTQFITEIIANYLASLINWPWCC